jgi:hypothetical protein
LFLCSGLTLAFISESESARAITDITRMATITRTDITDRIRTMATIDLTIGTAGTDTITATTVTTTITDIKVT